MRDVDEQCDVLESVIANLGDKAHVDYSLIVSLSEEHWQAFEADEAFRKQVVDTTKISELALDVADPEDTSRRVFEIIGPLLNVYSAHLLIVKRLEDVVSPAAADGDDAPRTDQLVGALSRGDLHEGSWDQSETWQSAVPEPPEKAGYGMDCGQAVEDPEEDVPEPPEELACDTNEGWANAGAHQDASSWQSAACQYVDDHDEAPEEPAYETSEDVHDDGGEAAAGLLPEEVETYQPHDGAEEWADHGPHENASWQRDGAPRDDTDSTLRALEEKVAALQEALSKVASSAGGTASASRKDRGRPKGACKGKDAFKTGGNAVPIGGKPGAKGSHKDSHKGSHKGSHAGFGGGNRRGGKRHSS